MKKDNILKRFFNSREIGVIIPLILLIVVFSFINKSFYNLQNITSMLESTSYIFIGAIGMTLVFLSGGLDLSIGSQLALSVIAVSMLLQSGLPIPVAIILTLILGFFIGSINGFLVISTKIPPFIATLATLYIFRGIVYGISKGVPVYPLPGLFKILGQSGLFRIPYIIFLTILLAILVQFILIKIPYGRYIYAIGGNIESARLSGINTKIIQFSTYAILGVLMSVVAIFWASRLGSGQPSMGSGLELKVISAVIIGGVSLFGGAGSLYGSFLGAMFLVILENGLTMSRVDPYWQQCILGIIIIFAILMDLIKRREISFIYLIKRKEI